MLRGTPAFRRIHARAYKHPTIAEKGINASIITSRTQTVMQLTSTYVRELPKPTFYAVRMKTLPQFCDTIPILSAP